MLLNFLYPVNLIMFLLWFFFLKTCCKSVDIGKLGPGVIRVETPLSDQWELVKKKIDMKKKIVKNIYISHRKIS